MRAARLAARSFRNLADFELELPPGGAVFLGPNAHGKTSLLESLYYPVLWRSFRAGSDQELGRWDGPGFQLGIDATWDDAAASFEVTFLIAARRKRILINGVEEGRISGLVGRWLAVAFLPADLGLVQGPAQERRRYLDRVLSLADAEYLGALTRYRATLSQRNAALRAGRESVARAFGRALAGPGAYVVSRRLAWIAEMDEGYARECDALGEPGRVGLRYRGRAELCDEAAWIPALEAAVAQELTRGMSLVGPQRDDLTLERDGRPLRDVGSTGQQRTAAVALKLCELDTLRRARAADPVLLLDDVFAELDRERQSRLAGRLGDPGARQVFVTSPRRDELPRELDLEVFEVWDGRVRPAGVTA